MNSSCSSCLCSAADSDRHPCFFVVVVAVPVSHKQVETVILKKDKFIQVSEYASLPVDASPAQPARWNAVMKLAVNQQILRFFFAVGSHTFKGSLRMSSKLATWFICTTTGDTPEQSKAIGCESPGTLSSIIIVQESAAMKTYETKKLSPL